MTSLLYQVAELSKMSYCMSFLISVMQVFWALPKLSKHLQVLYMTQYAVLRVAAEP